ncbi:hypothetical protein [Sphingobacterium chungjuense]|uniref:hypothetical protein n=1 Tax=Sphingobacterium chungjuense TaxID=2675553 RepID=UPI00140A416B|nr:hypothetical protein [Sphingobacterium chungjuense]
MSFQIEGLPNHVTANSRDFVYRSLSESDTIKFIQENGTFLVNVKNEEQINLLDTTAVVRKTTKGCGRQPLNTTELGAVNIKVHTLQSDQNLCIADLETTYQNQWLQSGSNYTSFDFIDSVTNLRADKLALSNEALIWAGDTESIDPDMMHFDGFFKLMDAENKAVTLPEADKLYKRLQLALATIPNAIKRQQDFVILLSKGNQDAMGIEVSNDNYFKAEDGITHLHGTTKRLKGVEGFDAVDTEYFVMARASNFYVATDMENEFNSVNLFHSQETGGNLYLDFKWKLGVQIARPEEIYIFKK